MSWLDLEHKCYRFLKALPGVKRVGLAVSGGQDSAALWGVMTNLAPALQWEIVLLHVHHGEDPSGEQREFRDAAQERVLSWGSASGAATHVFEHQGQVLKSEEDCRKVRREAFFNFHKALHLDFVLTAHHSQDLLETRLIHLIRGCGGEGLKSLKPQSEIFLRPFLTVPKLELEKYCEEKGLSFEQDPSNLNPDHSLRNWMRLKWLPELEKRRSGGVRTLADSLERVTRDLELMQRDNSEYGVLGPGQWDRHRLLSLPPEVRAQALVIGLQGLSDLQFTQGQVLEALKRLDNPQKDYKFSLSGMVWAVSPMKVKVTKIES